MHRAVRQTPTTTQDINLPGIQFTVREMVALSADETPFGREM